jgi:hypothetical protein
VGVGPSVICVICVSQVHNKYVGGKSTGSVMDKLKEEAESGSKEAKAALKGFL